MAINHITLLKISANASKQDVDEMFVNVKLSEETIRRSGTEQLHMVPK